MSVAKQPTPPRTTASSADNTPVSTGDRGRAERERDVAERAGHRQPEGDEGGGDRRVQRDESPDGERNEDDRDVGVSVEHERSDERRRERSHGRKEDEFGKAVDEARPVGLEQHADLSRESAERPAGDVSRHEGNSSVARPATTVRPRRPPPTASVAAAKASYGAGGGGEEANSARPAAASANATNP